MQQRRRDHNPWISGLDTHRAQLSSRIHHRPEACGTLNAARIDHG